MAEARVSEDLYQFSCPVCLDLLKDPVTIPCGHSFCMECINDRWDQEDEGGFYSCLQCRNTFNSRPVLKRNNMLAEVVEKLKTEHQAVSADHSCAVSGDVECDFCTGTKCKAIKSCLMCLVSYCATHLKPHYQSPAFKRHKLIEASSKLQENICPRHEKLFEIYCRTDQRCICSLCLLEEHKSHDTVTVEAQRTEKQNELTKDQRKSQQRIKEKQKKLTELKQAINTIKSCAQSAVEENEKMFDKAISCMQKKRREVTDQIRKQEMEELIQAEELKQKLEQEIADLRRRTTEQEKLSHTQDHIRFLQSFQSLCVSSGSEDSPDFTVKQMTPFDEMKKSLLHLKKQLEEFCKGELSKVPARAAPVNMIITSIRKSNIRMYSQHSRMNRCSTETQQAQASQMVSPLEPQQRIDFLKCFCKLTLDPVTVHCALRLSNNNRVVTASESKEKYPDHPDRFDFWKQVLCREAVRGRCYWEVEFTTVGGVHISVSYKGISRKEQDNKSRFGYNDSSWSLECSSSSAFFWHNSIKTVLQSSVSSRVGVYVHHSAGTLSFYSVSDKMKLLHRVQTKFTQTLYAGFWVGIKSSVRLCDKP